MIVSGWLLTPDAPEPPRLPAPDGKLPGTQAPRNNRRARAGRNQLKPRVKGSRRESESGTIAFFLERPDSVRLQILGYCDDEDQSFAKWENTGIGTEYAGGGIFITDEQHTVCGTDARLVYSGSSCAFAMIKNTASHVLPGQCGSCGGPTKPGTKAIRQA